MSKFYQKTWLIILLLILFAPIGIYLLVRYAKWQPKTKWIIGSACAVFFVLFSIAVYNAPPTLTIDNLNETSAAIRTDDATYKLTGKVSSLRSASLTVNDKAVKIAPDQSFEAIVVLAEGDNTIKIEARNDKGVDTINMKVHRTTAAELAERTRVAKEKAETERRTAEEKQAMAEKKKAEDATKISLAQQEVPTGDLYKVVGIVDGDTIKVSIDGKSVTIRLIGIDTPETQDSSTPVQCYGKEASSRMQHYVQSKQVRLSADSTQDDKDKYGRLLRYVFLEDGTNAAYQMIREGYGREYTYDKPYRYQTQFKEAERLASSEKNGLWAANTCNGDTTKAATSGTSPSTGSESTSGGSSSGSSSATVTPPAATTSGCDSNYSGGCVPVVSYDLDCKDIGFMVKVTGTDRHLFDANKDGYGCESYQ